MKEVNCFRGELACAAKQAIACFARGLLLCKNTHENLCVFLRRSKFGQAGTNHDQLGQAGTHHDQLAQPSLRDPRPAASSAFIYWFDGTPDCCLCAQPLCHLFFLPRRSRARRCFARLDFFFLVRGTLQLQLRLSVFHFVRHRRAHTESSHVETSGIPGT